MRIVFLVSSLGIGGAERVAVTLSNAWANRGDTVTLIPTYSGSSGNSYVIDERVEVVYLSDLVPLNIFGGKRMLRRLISLRKLIIDKKPDVVVSFLPNVNVASILSTFSSGLPCIICERSDPSVQPLNFALRWACKLLYRLADVVCVQTQAVSETIHKTYGGLKNVAVAPNPLSDAILKYESLKSISGRKSLLSLGRLSSEKRVSLVVEAFAELAERHSEWDLHIYGEGPCAGNLSEQIADLGLQTRIFLHGTTIQPWTVMAESDAFVIASIYEGFPNALLEAMCVGLPCVATDCSSGPREISNNGADAMLVGLNDFSALVSSLNKLMLDESYRDDLGARARASVRARYELTTVLTIWDKIFYSVGVGAKS